MTITQQTFTLSNGVSIPKIGFGTWQISNGAEAYESARAAISAGYRHIDTALAYGNEESIGRAVRDSGVPREELFITTKLPAEIKTAAGAREAFETSVKNLGVDYVDLYLIHAPWPWENRVDYNAENIEVWKVFEELYGAGKTKAIGVSNFEVPHLESLTSATDVLPHANQIRWFIGATQPETTSWCQERGIQVEGFSPLATGALLGSDQIREIADRHEKSVAQISIRYLLEKDVLPLPKTTSPARIAQNAEVDFSIPAEDLAILDSLTEKQVVTA